VLAQFEEYCFVEKPRVEITSLEDQIGLYGALAVGRSAMTSGVAHEESEQMKQVQD
jgi:hypothetical protein